MYVYRSGALLVLAAAMNCLPLVWVNIYAKLLLLYLQYTTAISTHFDVFIGDYICRCRHLLVLLVLNARAFLLDIHIYIYGIYICEVSLETCCCLLMSTHLYCSFVLKCKFECVCSPSFHFSFHFSFFNLLSKNMSSRTHLLGFVTRAYGCKIVERYVQHIFIGIRV